MNRYFLPQESQSTSVAALNVLFIGETSIGESSIIDLTAGEEEQKKTLPHAGRRDDARRITLDGKIFILYSSATNDLMSATAVEDGIRNTLTHLRRNGGLHLLVYCMNVSLLSHSATWTHKIHHTIVSYATSFARIPTVAVIAGISDVAQQEDWWSSNEGTFTAQGPHFDDHVFIPMSSTSAQPRTGDHISESRHILHTLILHNCAYSPGSETDSDPRSVAPYEQKSMSNSLQSLFPMLVGKSSSHTLNGPKSIDIVLLGEVGVGKSSLINLIARENVAEVSSDTIGCTRAPVKYTFEEQGRTFNLYDTPGLVDPQMGVEPFIGPIDTIQRLIRSLGNGSGPDLLLFCIDNSKPTTALQRNCRLFCKVICEGRVPIALAITKLEEGQGADEWWGQHGATIRRYGVVCSGHVGLGGGKRHSGSKGDSEGQSRESLLSFLVACADQQKSRTRRLRRMVTSAASSLRAQVWTPEKTLMNHCGLEESTARELASRLVALKESRKDGPKSVHDAPPYV